MMTVMVMTLETTMMIKNTVMVMVFLGDDDVDGNGDDDDDDDDDPVDAKLFHAFLVSVDE